MKKIDARGKACPIPVIMAKKEADQGTKAFTVTVDNRTAVENLNRFGINGGFKVGLEEISEEEFLLSFSHEGQPSVSQVQPEAAPKEISGGGPDPREEKTWGVFIGSQGIGEGDPEFSQTLMNMYLYTLSESDDIPKYILFMNQGVRIPTENEEATGHLKKLIEKGSQVLVCGACLNFYHLEDKLQAGQVSNMYSISEAMIELDKLISL